MRVWRVPGIALRLCWPYLLAPWRSPLLRWRMETYGILDEQGRMLHADEITPARFRRFLREQRRTLYRMLRWAASL